MTSDELIERIKSSQPKPGEHIQSHDRIYELLLEQAKLMKSIEDRVDKVDRDWPNLFKRS